MLSFSGLMSAKSKYFLWIGPHYNCKGGVSSFIKIYKDSGFFNNGKAKFLATMEDGNKAFKLYTFFLAYSKFIYMLLNIRLVHIHLSCKASFWRKLTFILISLIFKIPVIIHLHDSGFPNYYTKTFLAHKKIIKYILLKADRVLVLSAEINDFINYIDPFINTQIFPNPVVIKPIRSRKSLDSSKILFLSRITREKGIAELLEAIYLVRNKFPDIKLIIGGDGDMELLNNLICKYDLKDCIEVKGWVNSLARETLFQTCSMLVLPSYGEGQSMAILEAMESNLLVITTSVGGNTYLIDNKENGILVPPRNPKALAHAIFSVINNPEEKEKMVKAARLKVEQIFDSKKIMEKVHELYSRY